jgi:hypothetical protein
MRPDRTDALSKYPAQVMKRKDPPSGRAFLVWRARQDESGHCREVVPLTQPSGYETRRSVRVLSGPSRRPLRRTAARQCIAVMFEFRCAAFSVKRGSPASTRPKRGNLSTSQHLKGAQVRQQQPLDASKCEEPRATPAKTASRIKHDAAATTPTVTAKVRQIHKVADANISAHFSSEVKVSLRMLQTKTGNSAKDCLVEALRDLFTKCQTPVSIEPDERR